ncbi:MAG TPA: phage holin family protein [Caulobacteraceae bacterium]|nr:phage holin family protein [Caulobacteraceae bacterium]
MMGFIVRFLMVALSLWLAAQIVPGIEVRSTSSVLLAALILGLLNAIVRPVIILLTLPLTIVTLGLFLFVINAAMLWATSLFLHGFMVRGFFPALLGSIVVSAISWVGDRLTER